MSSPCLNENVKVLTKEKKLAFLGYKREKSQILEKNTQEREIGYMKEQTTSKKSNVKDSRKTESCTDNRKQSGK